MRHLLFIAVVACISVTVSSGIRIGIPYRSHNNRIKSLSSNDVSAYFYLILKDYFPNERYPTAKLIGTNYLGMGTSGGSAAPIEFSVRVQIQEGRSIKWCTALVHLGNPVTGMLDKLYYDQELKGCY